MFGNNSWVLIPIVAIIAGVVMTWIRARHGYPLGRRNWMGVEANARGETLGETEKLKADMAARDEMIAKLEERVRVLERIATDNPSKLSEEIDRLSA